MASIENHDNQLTISVELLYLINWLIDNESEKIKELIQHALENGFKENMGYTQHATKTNYKEHYHTFEDSYSVILDFFSLMDMLLEDEIKRKKAARISKKEEKKLIKTTERIDAKFYSQDIINKSLQNTTNHHTNKASQELQNILLKELLSKWDNIRSKQKVN